MYTNQQSAFNPLPSMTKLTTTLLKPSWHMNKLMNCLMNQKIMKSSTDF